MLGLEGIQGFDARAAAGHPDRQIRDIIDIVHRDAAPPPHHELFDIQVSGPQGQQMRGTFAKRNPGGNDIRLSVAQGGDHVRLFFNDQGAQADTQIIGERLDQIIFKSRGTVGALVITGRIVAGDENQLPPILDRLKIIEENGPLAGHQPEPGKNHHYEQAEYNGSAFHGI